MTADDIAQVVSRATGIPVETMLESERAKLLRMEDELKVGACCDGWMSGPRAFATPELTTPLPRPFSAASWARTMHWLPSATLFASIAPAFRSAIARLPLFFFWAPPAWAR